MGYKENVEMVLGFVELRKPGHIEKRRQLIKRLMNPIKVVTRSFGTRMFDHKSAARRAVDFRWM